MRFQGICLSVMCAVSVCVQARDQVIAFERKMLTVGPAKVCACGQAAQMRVYRGETFVHECEACGSNFAK